MPCALVPHHWVVQPISSNCHLIYAPGNSTSTSSSFSAWVPRPSGSIGSDGLGSSLIVQHYSSPVTSPRAPKQQKLIRQVPQRLFNLGVQAVQRSAAKASARCQCHVTHVFAARSRPTTMSLSLSLSDPCPCVMSFLPLSQCQFLDFGLGLWPTEGFFRYILLYSWGHCHCHLYNTRFVCSRN